MSGEFSSAPSELSDGGDGHGGGTHFQTLDVTRFRRALASLHEQVACSHGRVEVKRKGCDDVCVMISKAELEALERALEILAECSEYKAMCETLTSVVMDADGVRAPAQA